MVFLPRHDRKRGRTGSVLTNMMFTAVTGVTDGENWDRQDSYKYYVQNSDR